MKRGKFIVLEGGEGAGKGAVRKFLETKFPNAVFTREPGGTPLAEQIRRAMICPEAADASAETQFCLIFASRFEHVRAKIRPALEAGKMVISERFDSSTYAYQIFGQQAQHLKPTFLEFRKFLRDAVPDLYMYLSVDAEAGVHRVKRNSKKEEPVDHFESRGADFHNRVRAGYMEFLRTVPHAIVDASRPLEEVQREVLSIIQKHL